MANPNNIHRYSKRSMVLSFEEIFSSRKDAYSCEDELRKSGNYYIVKTTPFRIGPKSELVYYYAVRAYKK